MDKPNTAEEKIIGIINNKILPNKYTKYNNATHVLNNVPVELIGEVLQEHTAQTLDRLKEKIEINEAEISQGKSYSKAFVKGRISENKRIIKLIEEVNDE